LTDYRKSDKPFGRL